MRRLVVDENMPVTLRRVLVVLLAVTVAGPALPATAAGPAPDREPRPAVVLPGGDSARAEASALVRRPDGTLAVRRSGARPAAEARGLAERWRAEHHVVAADVAVPVQAFAVPAPDPLQPNQWALGATNAPATWELGDAAGQVVAVLDSGAQLDHPDLRGALVAGRDLVDGDHVPQDDNGHGTHVAGIAAAVAGNGRGVAGVALRGRVMPVRVLDAKGGGSSSAVAEGILWAVDNGATVVNLSLGGPKRDSVLEKAVEYALSRGVPVVAAAGNTALDGDPVNYPAALPGVIAVGAVDSKDTRPSFSSTGDHLSLVAPGVSVLSTTLGSSYGPMTGTSMAAPHVAAAVALLRAASPGSSPADLRTVLLRTAVDLGARGFDAEHGAGRLDVHAARTALVPVDGPFVSWSPTTGVADLLWRGAYGRAVHRSWSATDGLGAPAVVGGQVVGAPAGATRYGRFDVAARGLDNQAWTTARRTDGTWEPWSSLGGALTSRPAVASTGGRFDVVARGADGAVWHRGSSSPGAWSGWSSLGGQLLPGTAPDIVWTTAGRLELVAVGADRQVWRRTLTSAGWGGWRAMGGTTDADVSATSTASGVLNLVVRGADRAAWTRSLTTTADTGWRSLGGVLRGAPTAAAVPGGGRLDVLVLGDDGRPYVTSYTSAWSGWRAV
jgi:subtilisin family serine protease